MNHLQSIIIFNFYLALVFSCKNKEPEPIPTIDATNYDEKTSTLEEEEISPPADVIPEQKQDNNPVNSQAQEKTLQEDISYHDEYNGKSMIGHFIYFADAAVFTPCGQKKAIPVQMGTGEYLKLEKAYSATVEGGTPCFAEFLGKVKKLPSYDGGKKVDMIVVEKLIEVQFYRECP